MEQIDRSEPPETPIDLKEYLHLFWSWAWLIVLAGLVAGVTAYFISNRITPIYESSTSLLVSAPATGNGVIPSALVTTQTMTSTYSEMLIDWPVLQAVIDKLKLDTTPEELKKSITVDVVNNTQLLVITVDNPSPSLATDIANGMATVFTDRISQLQSQRFAVSIDVLTKQVSDMEGQIKNINDEIANTRIRQLCSSSRTGLLNTAPLIRTS